MINKLLGILGLIFGVAALAVGSLYPAKTVVTSALALTGFVLLSFFFISHFEAFKTFSRKRSSHLKINTVLMVVFFVFIVVLLNLIIRQYYFRYDMTSIKQFSLSPQGEKVALAIQDDVNINYFGIEGNMEFKRAIELLEAYRYLNKHIVYELHDLDRAPLLANKYDVKDYGTFVVESTGKVAKAAGVNEQTVTNLLIRGTRKNILNVRFLEGHGEKNISDDGRHGYSTIAGKLKDIGHNVSSLNLISAGKMPIDTDLLIVVSPESDLSEQEYAMLSDYTSRGGKLLILIDKPVQMNNYMTSFGLKTSQYPVYDPVNVAGTDPSTPLVKRYFKNPVIGDFSLTTVFPGVHEVRNNSKVSMEGLSYEFLVRSSRDAWYEMNGDGIMQEEEEYGNQVFAVLVSQEDELMKLIVFGDSDFASNAYINVGGNADLFLIVSNWLLGEGGLVEASAPKSEFIPMFVTVEQARFLKLMIPIGIPLIIIIAGTAVWYRRRSL
jgi:ABC-type uncharacterized transport system involved in gliding motility auxiliary subunit